MLSPTLGRFSALAKGARRSRRRFVNVLEPFTLLRAHLRGGNAHLSPFLDQADLVEAWEAIRFDPWRFVTAAYFAELVELFSKPRAGQEIFGLLQEALEVLSQEGTHPLFKLAFELKLLLLNGFGPELNLCVRCHTSASPFTAFSLEEGGLICEKCQKETDVSLSSRNISFLRACLRYPLSTIKRIRLCPEDLSQTASLIENYLLRILDHEVKALQVWKQMNTRRVLGEGLGRSE